MKPGPASRVPAGGEVGLGLAPGEGDAEAAKDHHSSRPCLVLTLGIIWALDLLKQ